MTEAPSKPISGPFPTERSKECPFDPADGYTEFREKEPIARVSCPAGIDAWLVGEASASALAAGLCRVLADAELRRALGEAGRRRAQELAWPRVAGALEQAQRDAVQQG